MWLFYKLLVNVFANVQFLPTIYLLFQKNLLTEPQKMQCFSLRFQTSWATNYVDWKLVVSFTNFPPIRITSLHRFLIRIHSGGCKKVYEVFFWITLCYSLGKEVWLLKNKIKSAHKSKLCMSDIQKKSNCTYKNSYLRIESPTKHLSPRCSLLQSSPVKLKTKISS